MKQLIKICCVAAIALVAASCVKEQIAPEYRSDADGLRKITVGFQTTKTTLSEQGATLWAEGDTLWASNGTSIEKWGIPEGSYGKDTATFCTAFSSKDTVYVVYPYSYAKGLTADGKFKVNVPSTIDGSDFAKANISVAKVLPVKDSLKVSVKMKNATGVMKFSIAPDAMYPPKAVGLSAPGQYIAGDCEIDLSSGLPVTSCESGSSMILVKGTEGGGTFYVPVIPCTLKEGFRYIGVGIDLNCESIASTKANIIEANDLVDLGAFGTRELKPLEGEGTQGSPYLVDNLPEWLAVTYFVNESPDNTLEGKYLKINADFDGVSIPVGKYEDGTDYYFKGNLDGAGHTIGVNISGGDYLGLFGELGGGACISDLTVEGSVSGAKDVAGLAGVINCGLKAGDKVLITNCTNKATVKGTSMVGGITGYCDTGNSSWAAKDTDTLGLHFIGCVNSGDVIASGLYAGGIAAQTGTALWKEFRNCTNSGNITGDNSIGGIVGYGYYDYLLSCTNSGTVTATSTSATGLYGLNGSTFKHYSGYNNGIGGIVGWAQNCDTILECTNTGAVSGPNKVGGIAGSTYWTGVSDCTNSGPITGTATITHGINFGSATGGIVGWVDCRYDVKKNTNSGTITAKGGCGGIVGVCQPSTSAIVYLDANVNNADIVSSGECAGGICGIAWNQAAAKYVYANNCINNGDVSASNSAGGIYGQMYDANNAKAGCANKCVNNGNIKAKYYAGGITGYCKTRSVRPAWYIFNCENHGTVSGVREDEQPSYSGGIVGAVQAYGTGLGLTNCYNTGLVKYANAAYAQPHAGGICGSFTMGTMQNVYNSGAVGLIEGEPAEGSEGYIGAIAGYNAATIKNAYWLAGTYAAALGTGSAAAADASVQSVSEAGILADGVQIGEAFYTELIPALNAWVGDNTSTYLLWKEGPAFVKE